MTEPRHFALVAGHGAIFLWVVNSSHGQNPEFSASALPLAGQVAAVALLGMTLAYLCTTTNRHRLRIGLEIFSGMLFVGILCLWIASVGFGVAFKTPFDL